MSVTLILDYLRQMNELQERMLESAHRKQQVLVRNEVQALTEVLMVESKLMKLMNELDAVRSQAVSSFLKEKGIRSQIQLNLTEITKLIFDMEQRNQVIEAQRVLTNTVMELKKVNETNQHLTKQSLAFIDYSLNLMIDYPEQDTTYQPPSARSGYKQSGLFDTRA